MRSKIKQGKKRSENWNTADFDSKARTKTKNGRTKTDSASIKANGTVKKPAKSRNPEQSASDRVFDFYDNDEYFPPRDLIDVAVDSIEASVTGYSSLLRQCGESFQRRSAFYRSSLGGSLSKEEARKEAYKPCTSKREAKELFEKLQRLSLRSLDFLSIVRLFHFAPRVAERFWEDVKLEGRKEFESGHLAANTMFPVGYMKDTWTVAKYLGVRESFIAEWKPKGGIELALIDLLAQSFFRYQYWVEQEIRTSETEPRREHYEYVEWKSRNGNDSKSKSWAEGHWFPRYVDEQEAIEHATKMADRWNRIFMRTLRQLRDLRRYSVTISQANQVNISRDGNTNVNIADQNTNGREDINRN